jgi:hypothetical protein
MRRVFAGVLSATVAACGIFGASDEPAASEEQPPPGTPQDNAQPPAVGGGPPVGIYVSSSQGQDDGSGSSVRPLKTLKQAFALAKERGLRVIACAEEYPENLVLVDGVSAFGYYDCKKTPWERGAPRAILRAPATPAVLATGITLPTRLEGFEVRAPDLDGTTATDEAGTSIALEVRESKGLIVSESLLHAGKGASGSDGKDGATNSVMVGVNGSNASDQHERVCSGMFAELCSKHLISGGPGGTTTCAIGAAGGPGGQGGDGRDYIDMAASDVPGDPRGRPFVATTETAIGGLNAQANGFGVGLNGPGGAAGTEGTDGANGTWSLTAKGFVRGNGIAGKPGSPGQGGGGGAGTVANWSSTGVNTSLPAGSTNYATATGGGGGAGGCAGQPGTPGTGGGASIGALVIDSGVTFEKTRIEAADGGRAGKGNLGTVGTPGTSGGNGTTHAIMTTGHGGNGGSGGAAGVSGHGAPGPSIALAFTSTRPTTTDTELAPSPGVAGQPEVNRTSASGTKVIPASPGASFNDYEIKP